MISYRLAGLCPRDDEVHEQRERGRHAGHNRRALRNVYPHLSCSETFLPFSFATSA